MDAIFCGNGSLLIQCAQVFRQAGGTISGVVTADAPIIAWAGPWPIEEHWWDPQRHRRLARFQMVTDDHDGYLVVAEHQRWWITARYD